MATPTQAHVPQSWNVGYLSFDNGKTAVEIESFDYTLEDGGMDVKTIIRGYGGRRQGAAMTNLNFSGEIPSSPTDGTAGGFTNSTMTTGTSTFPGGSAGVPLDQTMLTPFNSNGRKPITFIASNGLSGSSSTPAVEQYVFVGYISTIKVTGTLNSFKFSGTATGTFSVHEQP